MIKLYTRVLIAHKLKLVYFIVFKTGTRSVLYTIEQADETAERITIKENDIVNNKIVNLGDYYHFATIRHPLDRLLSAYVEAKNKKTQLYKTLFHDCLGVEDIEFDDFVKRICTDDVICQNLHIIQQSYLIPSQLDYVCFFENLQQDWEHIRYKFNLHKLPHLNKTDHQHYTHYYNEETTNLANSFYRCDIDRFEYGPKNE